MSDNLITAFLVFLVLIQGIMELWVGGQLNELIARKKIPQRKVKDIKWLYIPHDGLYNGSKLPSEEKYDGRIYLLPFIFAVITYVSTILMLITVMLVGLLVNNKIAFIIIMSFWVYFIVIIFFQLYYSIKYRKCSLPKKDYIQENRSKNDKQE